MRLFYSCYCYYALRLVLFFLVAYGSVCDRSFDFYICCLFRNLKQSVKMRGKTACRNAGGSPCKYLMKITSTEKNAMKENNKKKPTCHRVTPRSVKIIRLCFGFSSANCIIQVYGYNSEVGVLAWIQGLGDTENIRVQLGCDGMYRITGVSKAVTGFTGGLSRAYVEYSYEDDNLKTVSHSNTASAETKYTFNYGMFDALSTVYVGDKQLIWYEYDGDNHSYNLLRELYSNGGRKDYSYDSHGRVLSEKYDKNNSHVVTYAYDNEDNLGSVTDKRNNITQRYLYDLSGRQTEIIQSGSASRRQKFYYDEANNLSRYDENVNGKNFTSYYNYDKDNRQSEYKIGAIHRGWLYDGYGRLYDISTKLGANQVLHTTIYHENPDSTHVSTRVNGWKNETLGAREATSRTEQERNNHQLCVWCRRNASEKDSWQYDLHICL